VQANAAGVFTNNLVQASCVRRNRKLLPSDKIRAVLVNAGNANACNGDHGDEDNETMASLAARCLSIPPDQVLTASTGVIGKRLPVERIEKGVMELKSTLGRGVQTDAEVARAIMTTDTRPKHIAYSCRSDSWNGELILGGVCKGSGMIAPNMATMLCFLTTDAVIDPSLLQKVLRSAITKTFNRVTVDTDTSTNDTCLALASGKGSVVILEVDDSYADFAEALERICLYLAKEIARDGEGATKLVEVCVRNAKCEVDAERIAKTVAESPLVKTALFGNDPNWGRILAAAGRSGVKFNVDDTEILLGEIPVCMKGQSVPFDEKVAHRYLMGKEVQITIDPHEGEAQASVWTCDYSYDYIKINAEYHT
jgi:glutamate N-acetyltransferase/amino-acid N-acetyltransferase